MGIDMKNVKRNYGRKITILALIGLILGISLTATACSDKKAVPHVTYDILVSVPESADRAYLETIVTFENTSGATLNEAVFYLYPSADGYGDINVSNVRSGSDNLSYVTDGHILKANLHSLEPGDIVTLAIGATVTADKESRFVKSDGETLELFRFYPSLAYLGEDGFETTEYSVIGDSFKDPVADFKMTLRLGDGLEVLSGGTSTVNENGEIVFEIQTARSVGLFVGKGTDVKTESTNGVEVMAVGYDGDIKEIADVLLRIEEIVGEYPYKSFVAVCSGDEETRVGSGIVFLPKNANAFDVAYAIAKQWFGSYVGSDGYSEGWVADALAEHVGAMTCSENPEVYGALISESNSALEAYKKAVARTYGNNYIVRADACTSDYKTKFAYDTVVRRGGSVMYAGLVNVIGSKKYNKCLKSYVAEYGGRTVTGDELRAWFSRSCGMDISGILDAYLTGAVK